MATTSSGNASNLDNSYNESPVVSEASSPRDIIEADVCSRLSRPAPFTLYSS
jgi:hypothetical protein